jgi:hypothetical protein
MSQRKMMWRPRVDQSFAQERTTWRPGQLAGCGRWRPGVWENLPPRLLIAAQRLQGVSLEHDDALHLIPRWDRGDALIYIDPPYAGPLRVSPEKGYAVDDDGTLWSRLVEVLGEIRHAAVILSGYPCADAERLGWRMVPLVRKRTVRAEGASLLAPEVVWLSPAVPEVVGDLFSASVSA